MELCSCIILNNSRIVSDASLVGMSDNTECVVTCFQEVRLGVSDVAGATGSGTDSRNLNCAVTFTVGVFTVLIAHVYLLISRVLYK